MANLNTTTSSYPGTLDTAPTLTDGAGGNEIVAAHPNGRGSAIIAIETELGTDPRGSMADVKTRLAVVLNNDGTLKASAVGRVLRTAGALTTTSLTLVDVTGATVTLTTGAYPVHYGLSGVVRNNTAGQNVFLNIDIDGTLQFGTDGIIVTASGADYRLPIGLFGDSAALTAASHTVKAQWFVSANTGTLMADSATSLLFAVHELR